MSIAIIPLFLFLLLVLALPIVIGIYVYKDASLRGMNTALWTLLAVFAPGFVGLIIYLIVRSNTSDARCHKCSRLLLLFILVPISLCVLLVLSVTFFGFSKSSSHLSSFSYTMDVSVETESKNYPFLKDWVASCDVEGTGVYVLEDTDNRLPADTCRFFIYRNNGYYDSDIDVKENGFFFSKSEAHLTYLAPHEYSVKELMELGLEEAPMYTLTIFEFTGEDIKEIKIFDVNGKEMDYN